jgi:hypothetical protein
VLDVQRELIGSEELLPQAGCHIRNVSEVEFADQVERYQSVPFLQP